MKKLWQKLILTTLAAASFSSPANAQAVQEWSRPCASLIIDDDFRALIQAIRPDASGLNLNPDLQPWATVSISLPAVTENIVIEDLDSEKSRYLSLNFGDASGEPGFKVALLFSGLDLNGAKTKSDARRRLDGFDCRFAITAGAAKQRSDLSVHWSSSDQTWNASCSARFLVKTFATVDVTVMNESTDAIAYQGRFNAAVPAPLMNRINAESQRTLANASFDACY